MKKLFVLIWVMIMLGLLPLVAEEIVQGEWQATGISGKYFIDFRQMKNGRCSWNIGNWVLKSDFNEGDNGKGIVFTLIRPAGKIIFTGAMQGDKGSGSFTFEPDERFKDRLMKRGYERAIDKQLFSLAVYGLDENRIEKFENLAVPGMSLSKMIAFVIHDVSVDFILQIRKLGYREISASRLISFRIHDVDESFIRCIAKLGFNNISSSKLVSFKIHEVDEKFVREITELGYHQISSSHLISFRIHRVTPEFIKSIHRLGYKGISPSKLISFRIHGVDETFIKQVKEYRGSDVSASRLVSLKIHGDY